MFLQGPIRLLATLGHCRIREVAYKFNLALMGHALNIIDGDGIVNNSSNLPTLNTANGGIITFSSRTNAAGTTAGNANITIGLDGHVQFVTLASADHLPQGFTTAGSATITNNTGGDAEFLGLATTASHTTILNNGGATGFTGTSTAGSATITNNTGGITSFTGSSTAGNANITTNARAFAEFFNTSICQLLQSRR